MSEEMNTQEHAAVVITDENFDQIVSPESGLVLVDFWAAWCGPCRIMSPMVESFAKKYADQEGLIIGKMDVDASTIPSERLRVMSIPTFKMFFKGEEVGEIIGVVDEEELEKLIVDNLQRLPEPAAA